MDQKLWYRTNHEGPMETTNSNPAVDAAEQIEEEVFRGQSTDRSKVEEIKRKKQELRAAKAGKTSEVSEPKSDEEDVIGINHVEFEFGALKALGYYWTVLLQA